MQPSPLATEPARPAPATGSLPSLVRALAFGAAVVLVLLVAAWSAGLVPAANARHVALGVGMALLASTAALWLHGRFLDPSSSEPFAHDGRLMASRVQSLMAAAFGVKLVVLTVVALWLQHALAAEQPDVKFAATAAFCIAFAAAALVCQLATAGHLARALGRRRLVAKAASPTAPPVGERSTTHR